MFENTSPLILFGASLHAEVVADAIVAQGTYEIIGALDPGKAPGSRFSAHNIPVLGDDEVLDSLMRTYTDLHGVIAIGDNRTRKAIAEKVSLLFPDFRWATIIHPSAVRGSGVVPGAGTVVMAGSVIQTGSITGKHCLINTMASLDHHSVLGDYVHLAPGVHTGGEVRVGEGALVGIGASVLPRVEVEEWTIVSKSKS